MKILASKQPPSNEELATVLNREFSGNYSYQLFGFKSEKDLIVRKSPLVGAQISRRDNEIII